MARALNPTDYLIELKKGETVKIISSFSHLSETYYIVQIGILGQCLPGRYYFPDIYIINDTKKTSEFISNQMKCGVEKTNVDHKNGEFHIYGYLVGQCMQWDRHLISDGSYLGYINEDGTYEDVKYEDCEFTV